MKEKTVLHIDMDAFFASVERNRKNLKEPIVVCVYSGRSEDSGAVATCSYEAREMGIHAAMPITRAKKIAEDSEIHIYFVEMDREYYREVSDRIREEVLEKYGEKVEQASIDEAYLEIAGDIEHAVKNAEQMKNEIKRRFELTCSVGIAPNKLVAKIASDMEKPDGKTVVRESEVEEFMQELELDDIHGIGDKTVEKLKELGIDSVKGLAEADESILVREFGENLGLKLKEKAQGKDDSEVSDQNQKQITRITTLSENSDRASYIEKYFPSLANEIMEKVKEKEVSFRKVSLIAIDTEIQMYTRTTTLKSHVQDRKAIIENGEELLEDFLEEFEGGIRRIGLRVLDLKGFSDQRSLGEF
jgi:DNA polymerase IV (DinB-like DNA polymerase)